MNGPSQVFQALLAQAAACAKRGALGEAEKLIQQVLDRDPRHVGALVELGRIAYKRGNKRAAADCLRKAIAVQPEDHKLYKELGFVMMTLGDRQQALSAIMRAREIKPDDADTISNLGSLHLAEGRINEAVTAFRHCLEIDPDHFNARINLEVALKKAVPPWHLAMMNDVPRNSLYEEAIRRTVPGRSVLDIGTGAGLLAMMAARAGARWGATCEQAPWIAAKAGEVIAANGLSDRIKLIAKRSTDLRIGVDLPDRAEVLVSEVFGSSVINELVIPTLEHAHAQLLQPGAMVVPKAASARAYLAGGPELEANLFVDRAAGFTISPFNDFGVSKMGMDVSHVPHDVLSEDFEVFRFDLTRPSIPSEKRVIDAVAVRPGRCLGLVQWLRIALIDELAYENRPGSNTLINSWGHILYRFSAPIELRPGDRIRLVAQHNRDTLLIWDQTDSATLTPRVSKFANVVGGPE
jgi:predicted nicotinamide N-methyase